MQVRRRGDNEYLYEITPYYDKEKKQIRHTIKYLGKNVDGRPVKVRGTGKTPGKVLGYGEFQTLIKIIEELGLLEIFEEELPARSIKTVLLLAFNRVLRHLSIWNIEFWFEVSYLSEQEEYQALAVSSLRLSEFLKQIVDGDVHMGLFRGMVRKCSKSALIYDITSLSSYSKLIGLLEYGYNRDHLKAPRST